MSAQTNVFTAHDMCCGVLQIGILAVKTKHSKPVQIKVDNDDCKQTMGTNIR